LAVLSCSWHISRSKLRELIEASNSFTPECIEFQDKIAYRTGLGDATAVPPAVQTADGKNCNMDAARFEYNTTCFKAIQEVLQKTGIKPHRVNFVITNSSLFNPTPSLSAAIINHFKMPASTINYSLGGMGCSAGVIAMDLARELLCNHPNSVALVVSHENITLSYYTGEAAHGLLSGGSRQGVVVLQGLWWFWCCRSVECVSSKRKQHTVWTDRGQQAQHTGRRGVVVETKV
jgi:3-ketoacyl-CoA synthase